MPKQPGTPPSKTAIAGSLVACVGAACAGMLLTSVPRDESGGQQHLRAYHAAVDKPGVWTICDGDTVGVGPNTVETPAGCRARLERQLVGRGSAVLACAPGLRDHVNQLWAAVDFDYNTGAFCRSSSGALFNAGHASWSPACRAMAAYNHVTYPAPHAGYACRRRPDGKFSCIVPGLVNRRTSEINICLRDLPA